MKNTARQQAEMLTQSIGCEIEMYNITRSFAAKIASDFFGTHRYANTERRNGYKTWSAWDAQGREWKFQRDSSILAPDQEQCELSSPILTYADVETLQELIRVLRKAGGRSDCDHRCGCHVHIGANGHTPQTLRNLANIMASHEELLISALGITKYRIEHYCHTVNPWFVEQLNKKKPTTMAELADIWYEAGGDQRRTYHYNESRYAMLNYHATFTKGTIEFRLYQFDVPADGRKNGLNAGQLKAFIQLSLALSQMAKDVKTASPKPQQTDNPK